MQLAHTYLTHGYGIRLSVHGGLLVQLVLPINQYTAVPTAAELSWPAAHWGQGFSNEVLKCGRTFVAHNQQSLVSYPSETTTDRYGVCKSGVGFYND